LLQPVARVALFLSLSALLLRKPIVLQTPPVIVPFNSRLSSPTEQRYSKSALFDSVVRTLQRSSDHALPANVLC